MTLEGWEGMTHMAGLTQANLKMGTCCGCGLAAAAQVSECTAHMSHYLHTIAEAVVQVHAARGLVCY
jgi:hypothetical protein